MNRKGIRVSAIVLSVALAGFVAGCGQSTQTGASSTNSQSQGATKSKTITLGATVITSQIPFYADVINGMKDEAKAKGASIVVDDPNSNITAQTNQIHDLVQQKVNALIVYGVDPQAVDPAVDSAADAGIPVVTADMKLQTNKVKTFIGTDNEAAGKIAGDFAAKYIKDNMNGKANIGVLVWKSSTSQQLRMKGFEEEVKTLPGVKVVAELPGNDQATSLSSVQSMLQAHPDLNMIFTTNEGGALGAVNALEIANNKNVKLVGFDIDPQLAQAIQQKKILATVAQQPKLMGKMAVDAAIQAAQGDKLDAYEPLPAKLVTADNVAEFLK